jgi:predicted lipoprotein with Yx(FWY)xxD motif
VNPHERGSTDERITIFASPAFAAVLFAGAAVAHTSTPVARAATSPTIKVASTKLGKIIETGSGITVYQFTADRRNKDVCQTRSGCTSTWPPMTSTTKPTAGPGVNAHLLGTIKLAHAGTQSSYAGHPLYRYDRDSRGSTDYVGAKEFGGSWYALTPAGKRSCPACCEHRRLREGPQPTAEPEPPSGLQDADWQMVRNAEFS